MTCFWILRTPLSVFSLFCNVDWLMSCYRIGPWLQNCSMAVSKEKNLSPEAMQVQPVAHNSFSKLFSVTKYCWVQTVPIYSLFVRHLGVEVCACWFYLWSAAHCFETKVCYKIYFLPKSVSEHTCADACVRDLVFRKLWLCCKGEEFLSLTG